MTCEYVLIPCMNVLLSSCIVLLLGCLFLPLILQLVGISSRFSKHSRNRAESRGNRRTINLCWQCLYSIFPPWIICIVLTCFQITHCEAVCWVCWSSSLEFRALKLDTYHQKLDQVRYIAWVK